MKKDVLEYTSASLCNDGKVTNALQCEEILLNTRQLLGFHQHYFHINYG